MRSRCTQGHHLRLSRLLLGVLVMPFKSDKQRAFMYSQHPEIAKRWRKENGPQTDLPEYAGDTDKKHHKALDGLKKAHSKHKD